MNSINLLPIKPTERIERIDILRGFALLGILLVNVFGYHASFYHFGEFYSGLENSTDVAYFHWMVNLGSDKFIFLFSILFGFGFWMLQNKFHGNDRGFTMFYSRRMFALGLFGVLHIVLLWAGDILLVYSILGLLLLAIRKLPTKTLLVIAVLSYFFSAWFIALRSFIPALPDPLSTLTTLSMDQIIQIYGQGNFIDIMLTRINEYLVFRNINLLYYAPKVFSLFIVGYIAGRTNMLGKIKQKSLSYFFVTISFFIAGLILIFKLEAFLNFFSHPESDFYTSWYIFIYESGNGFLGLGYLLLILLISQTKFGLKILDPFKYAGRMALTNYLMQSLIFTTIFYAYGFGLFAQVRPWQFLLWGLLVFIIQVIFSKIWLTWFRFGSLEYVWRRMTYGRPLKK